MRKVAVPDVPGFYAADIQDFLDKYGCPTEHQEQATQYVLRAMHFFWSHETWVNDKSYRAVKRKKRVSLRQRATKLSAELKKLNDDMEGQGHVLFKHTAENLRSAEYELLSASVQIVDAPASETKGGPKRRICLQNSIIHAMQAYIFILGKLPGTSTAKRPSPFNRFALDLMRIAEPETERLPVSRSWLNDLIRAERELLQTVHRERLS